MAEEEQETAAAALSADYDDTDTDPDNQPAISYAQLVGYTVRNANDGNKPVGEIAYIDRQTINTMFELTDGTLLPAAEELILSIDTATRTITMDIPDGLI